MKDCTFILKEKLALSETVSMLRFSGDASDITAPGQFVMLSVPGKFLRRPFSVCDWESTWFTILVERVGEGTFLLQQMTCGTELSVLTGLGNGFLMRLSPSDAPLLIAGGTGLSPLVGLSRRLISSGVRPHVLLGFRSLQDAFGSNLFPGADVQITTDVFTTMSTVPHTCFYACGSEAMMTELCRTERVSGQVAFDVRMGCGFGACMGCSKKTVSGMKRVCKDGPVFRKEELLWDD